METFSVLMALCAENSTATGEFPSQRLVTQSCGVFFELWVNKLLIKQSRPQWFVLPMRSVWWHCNDLGCTYIFYLFLIHQNFEKEIVHFMVNLEHKIYLINSSDWNGTVQLDENHRKETLILDIFLINPQIFIFMVCPCYSWCLIVSLCNEKQC